MQNNQEEFLHDLAAYMTCPFHAFINLSMFTIIPRDSSFFCTASKVISKFVMAGRYSSKDLLRLRKIGIDHLGIVSERKKIDLFRMAKVFLFPPLYKHFGIGVGEAFSTNMIVIAWKIPAFEERFSSQSIVSLKLIKSW